MLKNCTHIRAFRCGNVVSSAREFRHEPRAQIVSGAKQENLWHASFSHASNLPLNLLADGLIGPFTIRSTWLDEMPAEIYFSVGATFSHTTA